MSIAERYLSKEVEQEEWSGLSKKSGVACRTKGAEHHVEQKECSSQVRGVEHHVKREEQRNMLIKRYGTTSQVRRAKHVKQEK